MMNALWVRDVVAFSAQIAALVLAVAGVAVVCRLRQPRAMLTFWRVLLFACLALPLYQPWHVPQAAVAFDGQQVLEATTTAVSNAPAVSVPTRRSMSLVDLLFVVMLAGTAIQASWLAVGAIGLRRLRRGASPLSPLPEGIREAQVRLGTRSEILVSERASGPMTFGFFRPVVLLPSDVAEMPPHVQQAMAYHELIHVRRRDWISELFEEGVRAILWFHPAVWWLIGRIRLSREQVVDEAVIRITQSREHYIDALLVVGPDHGRVLGAWSRSRIQAELFDRTDGKFASPERILLAYAGGDAGLFSMVFGGWVSGSMGSQPQVASVEPWR